jgi:predicted acyl esterase
MRKPRFIAEQGRKPTGLLGQIVARVMAKQTADANDFALKLLQLRPDDAVLEIGSGMATPSQRPRIRPLAVFCAGSTSQR